MAYFSNVQYEQQPATKNTWFVFSNYRTYVDCYYIRGIRRLTIMIFYSGEPRSWPPQFQTQLVA
jgi:hypothetical protein